MRLVGDSGVRRAPAWLRMLGEGLALVLFWVSVLAVLVLLVIPLLTGSRTYSVLTGSMAPGYEPGTLLVVRPVDFDTLRTGDVVTYQMHSGRPEVVTHRIVAFTAAQDGSRLLITRGDNNDASDATPVKEVQVRGSLLYAVPRVGFLAQALDQSGRAWVVTAVAVALIAWGIATMVAPARRRRGRTHVPARREAS